jgi:hypothetical protein
MVKLMHLPALFAKKYLKLTVNFNVKRPAFTPLSPDPEPPQEPGDRKGAF